MQDQKAATFLLVDDDKVFRMAVARTLRKLRIENALLTASDGVEALSLLEDCNAENARQMRPTIVLLDLHMPRMNGVEFCEALDKRLPSARLVVFAFSATIMPNHLRARLDPHVSGYVSKENLADSLWQVLRVSGQKVELSPSQTLQ